MDSLLFLTKFFRLPFIVFMCAAVLSCSPGLTPQEKTTKRAVQLLGSTLKKAPFAGPMLLETTCIEDGMAIVVYPESSADQHEIDKYYVFWVHRETVHAVNQRASVCYPELSQCPSVVSLHKIIASIKAETGLMLKAESDAPEKTGLNGDRHL